MDLLSAKKLSQLIRGCALNERESQKTLYNSFYSYGMAICDRYAKRKDESIEIYNDGFLKIFKEIHRYTPAYEDEIKSFKGWVRKILIYTAIDHTRKYNKHYFTSEIETTLIYLPTNDETPIDRMSSDEIITAIQNLSPAYRAVLNMFIVDGFSHEEISKHLGITIGTSKSNLFKARQQLQKIIKNDHKILVAKNAR
ncbi:MAG: RNA polymerase sigma factor [Ginsengibacter sp.]